MKKFLILLSMLFCFTAYAQTETLNWYMDGQTYATTTCESGNDILLPTTPTKRGYTFKGWASYTPIEYLESTGTQYIDTGFNPNNNTRIVADIKVTNFREVSAGLNLVYGSRTSGVKKFELFICSKDVPNSFRTDYGDETAIITTSKSLYNLRVVADKNKNRTTIYEGSTLLSTQYFEPETFVANNSLFLFMNNIDGVASTQSFIQMFSCKIYDNDILVRDFIPVLDPDGVPCMFDKVEKKFYYNAGTGDFIAGPIIGAE